MGECYQTALVHLPTHIKNNLGFRVSTFGTPLCHRLSTHKYVKISRWPTESAHVSVIIWVQCESLSLRGARVF